MSFKYNSILSQKKILYLPIEIYSREFYSKLYLAFEASLKGYVVLIGPEYNINLFIKFLPKGFYLGNGFHLKASNFAKIAKSYGHIVLSHDEEGLVRLKSKYYREYRVNDSIEKFSDYLLCWGRNHSKILKNFFKKKKILSVGNHRIDLLNNANFLFSSEVKSIKKKFGNYVLINGSFGSANHMNGENYLLKNLEERGWFDDTKKKNYQLRRIAFQKKIFYQMMNLSIDIARSGQKVLVRPHPSENIRIWKNYTKEFSDKIKIIRSGNVIPWIIASKLIIHNGCTTAIESYLLKKQIISFRPFVEKNVESILPNALGVTLSKKKEIVEFIKNFKEGDKYDVNFNLNSFIEKTNLNHNFTNRFLSLLSSIHLKNKKKKLFIIKFFLLKIFSIKQKLSFFKNKKNLTYLYSKCPKLKINKVKTFLTLVSKLKNYQKKINVAPFDSHSIIIFQSKKTK